MPSSRTTLALAALIFTQPALVTPAAAQTLQDALALAYANNPTLQTARAQLRAVDENVAQALAGWRPTVQVTAAIGQTTSSAVGQTVTGPNQPVPPRTVTPWRSRDPASYQASATQPLYRGGRTVAVSGTKLRAGAGAASSAMISATRPRPICRPPVSST